MTELTTRCAKPLVSAVVIDGLKPQPSHYHVDCNHVYTLKLCSAEQSAVLSGLRSLQSPPTIKSLRFLGWLDVDPRDRSGGGAHYCVARCWPALCAPAAAPPSPPRGGNCAPSSCSSLLSSLHSITQIHTHSLI